MSPPESEGKGEKDSEASQSPKVDMQPAEQPADLIPAPPSPPDTKTPVQFAQQITFNQIPQSAWGQLDADQIVDLSKTILHHANVIDERHFKFAMSQSVRDANGKKWSTTVGGIIAVAGFGVATLLATAGHPHVAIAVAVMIGTILATVVGNRFLD